MALFHPAFSSPTSFKISYHKPDLPVARETPEQETTIEIPFTPELEGLQKIKMDIHTDPNYPAYIMPEHINAWFSACLGYPAWLAYIGDSLGVPKEDEKAAQWKSSLKLPTKAISSVAFSDSAPLLVVSESSLSNLGPLLAGEEVILEKLRPNIVITDPELEAWDEDYWGELVLDRLNLRIILTANCARCRSINVDLEKGTKAQGNSGKLLGLMQKDRRVDPGSKYSPIFGRYGFPTSGGEVRVGDQVRVSVICRSEVHCGKWQGTWQLTIAMSVDEYRSVLFSTL